jgi:hypothetical protein
MTRLKVSNLDEISDLPLPRVIRNYDGEVIHIAKRRGRKIHPNETQTSAYITNCNRVMRDAWGEHRISQYRICKRCGTDADFQQVVEDYKAEAARNRAELAAERRMQNARFEAERTWTQLWEKLDAAILNDFELMIESGKALIPLSNADLAYVRTLVRRRARQIEQFTTPTETDLAELRRDMELLDEVLT